jgi:beta-mannosidase
MYIGDMHFYSYDCDCEDPQSYPSARFISEFGFQSLPSFSTIKTVSDENDWYKDSEFMKYRQRHEGGTSSSCNSMCLFPFV